MERERPLLIPFVALSAGLCLSDYLDVVLPISAVAAVFCSLLLSCCIRNRLPFAVAGFAFFFVWGLYALTPWKAHPPAPDNIQHQSGRTPVIVEGVVNSRPVAVSGASGLSGSFVLRVEQVLFDGAPFPAAGNLMVYVAAGEIDLARGDRVRLSSRITVPVKLGLPGEFDFPRYLSFRGVDATARVASVTDLVLMRGAAEDTLLRRIDLAARRLGDFIRDALPDERLSSVVTALLIGDQRRIPQALTDAYTRAGVNHILSISGFHVGIIAFFVIQAVLLIATRFEWPALHGNLRRAAVLIALPAMVLYLFLTGAAPATARSVVMLGCFVLALYAEREVDPVNALLLSALLLLSLNPPSLFDISFQLSFLALWGIVVFVPPVMRRFESLTKGWQRSLLQFIAASCAASVATTVPVLFVFNQASLNGILSNFLIVPLLGYGAVLAGLCGLLCVPFCTALAHLLLWVTAQLVRLSNMLVELFARLPLLTFHGITALDMLAFLLCMCVVTFVRPGRARHALCVLLPSLAVMAHLATAPQADGRLHVTMLSVGQAESLLFRLPDGSTMLVDGGGYLHDNGRDFGERLLGPALFKLGVRRIDHMVMTHSHPDHVGGLPFVATTFPVGEFWEAAPGGNGPLYDRLRSALAARQVPVRNLSAGDTFELPGGVTLQVLSPPPTAEEAVDDTGMNENSLVFRLTHGSLSILCTADTGFPAEEQMLAAGGDLKSTVLKVGHHGSRFSTSETFLDRVAPRLALISAGKGNSFGLPAARTVDLLASRGIETYRTDRDGTVELVGNGTTWNVATPYRPRLK